MGSLLCATLFLSYITPSLQHGWLDWPPQRSSLWRHGFNTPKNYNDNALYCGGRQELAMANGKCGVCGDSYHGIKDHEAGGKYALGVIAESYPAGVDAIDVTVKLSTHHKGFFEFRICPHNNPDVPVTQECLDRHLLHIQEGTPESGYTRFYPQKHQGIDIYNLHVEIPSGMTCSQCVLSWRYKTGNSWGVDARGRGCLGCGLQEEFRNCADIRIGNDETSSGENDVNQDLAQSESASEEIKSSKEQSAEIHSVVDVENGKLRKQTIDTQSVESSFNKRNSIGVANVPLGLSTAHRSEIKSVNNVKNVITDYPDPTIVSKVSSLNNVRNVVDYPIPTITSKLSLNNVRNNVNYPIPTITSKLSLNNVRNNVDYPNPTITSKVSVNNVRNNVDYPDPTITTKISLNNVEKLMMDFPSPTVQTKSISFPNNVTFPEFYDRHAIHKSFIKPTAFSLTPSMTLPSVKRNFQKSDLLQSKEVLGVKHFTKNENSALHTNTESKNMLKRQKSENNRNLPNKGSIIPKQINVNLSKTKGDKQIIGMNVNDVPSSIIPKRKTWKNRKLNSRRQNINFLQSDGGNILIFPRNFQGQKQTANIPKISFIENKTTQKRPIAKVKPSPVPSQARSPVRSQARSPVRSPARLFPLKREFMKKVIKIKRPEPKMKLSRDKFSTNRNKNEIFRGFLQNKSFLQTQNRFRTPRRILQPRTPAETSIPRRRVTPNIQRTGRNRNRHIYVIPRNRNQNLLRLFPQQMRNNFRRSPFRPSRSQTISVNQFQRTPRQLNQINFSRQRRVLESLRRTIPRRRNNSVFFRNRFVG